MHRALAQRGRAGGDFEVSLLDVGGLCVSCVSSNSGGLTVHTRFPQYCTVLPYVHSSMTYKEPPRARD